MCIVEKKVKIKILQNRLKIDSGACMIYYFIVIYIYIYIK